MLCTAGLYVVYSRAVCCVQQGCMLCTVGLCVVYSRAVCCVQWGCMLCTVGLYVVYSRAVCCVQWARMLCTVGLYVVYMAYSFTPPCAELQGVQYRLRERAWHSAGCSLSLSALLFKCDYHGCTLCGWQV